MNNYICMLHKHINESHNRLKALSTKQEWTTQVPRNDLLKGNDTLLIGDVKATIAPIAQPQIIYTQPTNCVHSLFINSPTWL